MIVIDMALVCYAGLTRLDSLTPNTMRDLARPYQDVTGCQSGLICFSVRYLKLSVAGGVALYGYHDAYDTIDVYVWHLSDKSAVSMPKGASDV